MGPEEIDNLILNGQVEEASAATDGGLVCGSASRFTGRGLLSHSLYHSCVRFVQKSYTSYTSYTEMQRSPSPLLTCTICTCLANLMPRPYTRIPLDVKPDFAAEIDRALAKLALHTGERQTRTSFIVRAVRAEIRRIEKDYPNTQPTVK